MTGRLRPKDLNGRCPLADSALCVPVLRLLARPQPGTAKTQESRGADDVASFVKLPLAVVFRSVVFTGLSTCISLHAQQRTQGGTTAGAFALFLLFLGGAVGSVLGGSLATATTGSVSRAGPTCFPPPPSPE